MIWNHGLRRQFVFSAIFLLLHILSAAAGVDTELVNALAGEDAVARFMAEEKLVQMVDDAIPALEPLAASSGFAPARQYAINVLAQIGTEKAVHLLLRILDEEPDVMVRAMICRHLGRLGVEEAVPIIGRWLFTIRGKAFDYGGEPQVVNLWYAWAVHVHALREIGSEKGIPVLQKMLSVKHGGRAGREFTNTYRENLRELMLEAAFYYRGGLDFYTSILQLWIGAVYDEQVDEIYQQYAEAFGEEGWRSADHEERWDTMKAYLFFFNRDGATRNIEAGNLTPGQRERLEDRLRIYIEDLINPDSGFGGDFSFSRKAWVIERAGMFWHAAFRREFAGRYAIRVCSRYYAAVADEMERVFGDPVRADLYRQKSAWWRSRGLREFQFCNGDRVLARLKDRGKLKRLNRGQVIAVLKKGLRAEDADARLTSVWLLADMGEFETLKQAMQDSEAELRKAAVEAFADSMYLPGLALALRDKDALISATAEAALKAEPESVGPYLRAVHFLSQGLRDERTRAFAAEQLRELSGLNQGEDVTGWLSWAEQTTGGMSSGVLVEYFGEADRTKPAASDVFETVDIGMKFQANFPKVWYRDEYWPKPGIFPDNAQGPFRLQITANLYVPADGNYRFYVKTEVTNRATLSITRRDGKEEEIISPRNEDKLQYIMQSGMGTHRIDFSEPVALKKGLAKLTIVYSGEEVRKIHNEHIVRISGIQKAGIQLFWSSDNHLMELVPAANLFHSGALPALK